MNNFNLEVNDKLEVVMGDKIYRALIIDVQEDFLRINLPVNNGEYLMLNPKEEIEMNSYLDENGCFNFYSKIISRGREGNIIYYEISKPFNITKIQRRNFFRVSLVDEVEYKIITNAKEEEFDNIPYEKGLMVDLSAGGLKLKGNGKIDGTDLILVNFKLNSIQFEVKCDIVRIENTMDKQKLCGLRFLDITNAQSEKIIQGLFEIVRRQRANA
ncbi:type IV pilus assembly PilZ [Clostridium sp. DL-VIII]|uniref:flagellar brake protein n=1 Tax=Clostridium sp. DL-VIII TaxID=641107 RepID=UPI00023B05CC|nr:PilZ domain-containing protein [Clostridium sp. DL-VIII]EHJ01466.1 type IV pilus assembly PilZ [Clostridium sp. DL-VIII]